LKKFILKLVIILCLTFACESDDVCDSTTPTTPSLVIEVYDATNTSTIKNLTNLKVREVGNPNFLIFSESNSVFMNANKFKLPLKSDANTVSFEFTLNGDVNSTGTPNPAVNKDIIKLDYTTKSIYISRACGFKTEYEIGNFSYNTNISDAPLENFKWINNVQLITKTINNEKEVHLKIFF
jgi:hypothetical protein